MKRKWETGNTETDHSGHITPVFEQYKERRTMWMKLTRTKGKGSIAFSINESALFGLLKQQFWASLIMFGNIKQNIEPNFRWLNIIPSYSATSDPWKSPGLIIAQHFPNKVIIAFTNCLISGLMQGAKQAFTDNLVLFFRKSKFKIRKSV